MRLQGTSKVPQDFVNSLGTLKVSFKSLRNLQDLGKKSLRFLSTHPTEDLFVLKYVVLKLVSLFQEGDKNSEQHCEKYMLRRMYEDIVAPEVLWRTKAMQCEGI